MEWKKTAEERPHFVSPLSPPPRPSTHVSTSFFIFLFLANDIYQLYQKPLTFLPFSFRYEKALRVTETTTTMTGSGEMHQAAAAAAIYYGAQSLPAVQAALLRRLEAKQQQSQLYQRKSDPPTTSDSLVERLKWLTTTDDDPQEERPTLEAATTADTTASDVVREAADGVSDPELTSGASSSIGAESPMAPPTSSVSSSTTATNPAPAKPPKSSANAAEKSTYRKLNELFFRSSKSKDKNNKQEASSSAEKTSPNEWKTASVMALNRSFSPPPPAEVEPSKMRPSGSKKGGPNHHHHHHLIHIVGLPSAGNNGNELLGRIPNVVPTVDHVYRAAVDLVTRNEQLVYGGGAAAAQGYGLDDIDAALRQGHHLHPSAAGVIVTDDISGRDEVASSGGGSRSSGSSGDSGLGSHETSLAGGSDVAEATGGTATTTTLSSTAANDELQAFVRHDATQSRIDRIKKRYSAALEDEAEDYGFLRRPSVRGIKTRFGSTSEIMQQMQAQLAPPQGTYHHQQTQPEEASHQAQALLDPRDKRRSALVMVSSNSGNGGVNTVMTNSVQLPALPEDAAYFQTQPGPTASIRPGQHPLISRPSSVMNIYGSTGDLYQHLRAVPRPVIMQQQRQHPSSSSAVHTVGLPPSYTMAMLQQQQQQQQHILERTSSVSSALDGGSSNTSAIYGTIRRQPMQMQLMQPAMYNPVAPQVESLSSPTRGGEYQQQQPLRMSMSTPVSAAAPGSNNQPPPRPLVHPTAHGVYAGPVGYFPVQDYQQQQQYATLPAKRQSPYGVPSQQQQQLMLDPTRYRQVLPAAQQQQQLVHHLRPVSAMMMHDPVRQSAPPPLPPAPLKDEREGPEGASSSPGLNHHDVSM